MKMLQAFGEFVDRHGIRPSHRILVAVSGGMDSMSLLHLLKKLELQVSVAHVNFKLRGTESDADQRLVEAFCLQHKVPFFTKALPIDKSTTKDGVQAEARRLRYAWFDELLQEQDFDFLFTAHHLDDAIETLFMNLLRGAGIKGLKSIPERNGYVLRPLLNISREEILEYAKAENVQWREDASNAGDDYLRNRIRHGIAREFESLAPNAAKNASKSIGYLAEADAYLDKAARDFLNKHGGDPSAPIFSIGLEAIETLWKYPALGKYVFDMLGFDPNQLDASKALSESQSGKMIEGITHRMYRDRGRFVFSKPLEDPSVEILITGEKGHIDYPLKLEWDTVKIPLDWRTNPAKGNGALLAKEKLVFPLTLRLWKPGDKFVPFGMRGQKKLSDFFVDQKLSVPEKERVYVLVSGDDVCWVLDHRLDDRYKLTDKTQYAFRILIQP
jgi:tRNA(Ile)-lysidine synthase